MTLRIGELATLTGERVRTLRFWTDRGLLLANRTQSAYRVYGPEAQERVMFIRTAQTFGLTLEAIARLLRAVDTEHRPCGRVQGELETRLQAVREEIASLMKVERLLDNRLHEMQGVPCVGPDCHYLPSPIASRA